MSTEIVWKVVLLALALFGLNAVDFLGLGLSETLRTAPLPMLAVALLDTLIAVAAVRRSRWGGWRLALALFLAFYGLSTLLVAVEAAYLSDVLTPELVRKLLLNGALQAALFALLAVRLLGRPADHQQGPRSELPWHAWLWRLPVLAFAWVVLFVLAGLLVFTPIVKAIDPSALDFYADLPMPEWILPFQAGRGLAMALLALPLLRSLRGGRLETSLLAGLLFGTLMGANLLIPAGLPPALQAGHLVEVFAENFLFGMLSARLLVPGEPRVQTGQLTPRLSRAA